eukprot:459049-Pyramimonas_sp.AAC.1
MAELTFLWGWPGGPRRAVREPRAVPARRVAPPRPTRAAQRTAVGQDGPSPSLLNSQADATVWPRSCVD